MKLRPITERPNIIKPIYCCPVCGTMYHSFDHAQSCKDSYPIEEQFPGLKVGDVVIVPSYYTWHGPGMERWIGKRKPAKPKSPSHFDHQVTFDFYYVVTHIGVDDDARRPRHFEDNRRAPRGIVSMVTHGMCQPGEFSHVWNTKQGHTGWYIPENQEALKHLAEEVQDYLGKQSHVLL